MAVSAAVLLGSGCSGGTRSGERTTSAPAATASTAPASPPGSPSGKPKVTLRLLDGGEAKTLTACGARARYPTYTYGGFVRYSGEVTSPPAGKYTVKVKLKRCTPRGYSETFIDIVDGRPDGSFSGQVPRLNPNEFYVRADLQRPQGTVLGTPVYFRVVRG